RNDVEGYEEEFEFIETAFNELKSIINVGINIDANKELAIFSKKFISLFEAANELYTEKKKQKSYLDFEDLLLFARKILQKENVQQSLSEKLKYIMIDEYQDTNEIQYEIVMPLLDDLRKGNLFVVGDEKQSIYSFREAELELFERTRDKIKENGTNGLILSLPHSFRMYPGLVLFVNKLFQRLFQNANKDFNEVDYSNLVCTKNDSELGKVGLLISEKENQISEATLVVKKIIELNQLEKHKFNDFAILCRKRNAFVDLENELVKNKIPYTIVGGKGFYQQQIIYDIYNYLSFITNQKDDAALLGILRAPFFNLSDLELYEISKEDCETFFEKLVNLSNKKNKLESIVEALQKNISIAKSSSLPNLIRKILVESGYWALIAHKNNSEQELANIEKLLGIAREFSSKPFS
ncbi:MAG: UvrD-helicase domain-containing protein, partial [Ignavibacteriaceae bacterium]|nr:UvrD-helicase domain-containing protein [Ignavibacteriaceae bacterium]